MKKVTEVMRKPELVSAVVEQTGLTKKDSAKAVDAIFDCIQSVLKDGNTVDILGFGKFECRERAARKGRNPQNGQQIEIAATRVPAFKPGKTLKDAVKQ